MPTQSDVAKLAGVSTASVSRVLNDRGVVTAEVRVKVRQAIDTLQYVPHASARALAMQRTGILGAIIPTLNNAIFAAGIHAFERIAQQSGYTLLLALSDASEEKHAQQVIKMIERGVDGLLLVGNDHDHQIFERLEKTGVRHVCAWTHDASARAANIGCDNARAMFDVVDHLVELGHRHFGMLAGLTARNDRARERVKGVVTRLNQHAIALEPSRIVEVTDSIYDSRKAFWQVIENDLTALICDNDVIAFGACLEAQKMGLQLPGDLSVTGFDDLALSSEIEPAMTTVHVGAQCIGQQAAHALIQAVENKSAVNGVCLPTRLAIRETTGCPPRD